MARPGVELVHVIPQGPHTALEVALATALALPELGRYAASDGN